MQTSIIKTIFLRILTVSFLTLFSFHFSYDFIKNKNILAIQEIKEEYTYVGKTDFVNYYYIRDSKENIKEYYIHPDLNLELNPDQKITVYKIYYDYEKSNGLYQWVYDKILLKNEFSLYETISFTENLT